MIEDDRAEVAVPMPPSAKLAELEREVAGAQR